MHIDEVVRETGLEASKISSILVDLEMKGVVKNLGEGRFVVRSV